MDHLDSIKGLLLQWYVLDYDSMPSEDDKKGESKVSVLRGWNNIKYDSIVEMDILRAECKEHCMVFEGSDTDGKII